MEEKIYPKKVRLGLLGDSSVGKTSICKSFLGKEFQEEMISTIADLIN